MAEYVSTRGSEINHFPRNKQNAFRNQQDQNRYSPLTSQFASSFSILPNDLSPTAAASGNRNYPDNQFRSQPSIRITEQSTHESPLPSYQLQQTQDVWENPANISHLFPGHRNTRFSRPSPIAGHKRSSSGSTIASTGPSSPFTPASSTYPHIVDTDSLNYCFHPDLYENPSSLVHTKAFTTTNHNNTYTEPYLVSKFGASPLSYDHAVSQAHLQFAMRDQMAHPVVEMGPAEGLQKTPSGEFSDEYKASMESRNGVPKLDRTMSDIYQDELYNPSISIGSSQPQQSPRKVSEDAQTPHKRDVFSERLQAANNGHMSARSASPAASLSRDRSPFRPNSKYANDDVPVDHPSSPTSRLGSAADLRQRQKAEADAQALARHTHKNEIQHTRTISPKEALLDVREHDEENMSPLFGSEESPQSATQNNGFSARRDVSSPTSANIAQSTNNQTGNSRRQTTAQLPGQYPFISQPRRQNSSMQSNSDSVPEFPAHLTSMESTRSDSKSSQSQSETSEIRRPSNTTADSGTYSCTYHGCALRFETPAKLQRHKRDGHRQATPPNVPGSDSPANRNSQAGPHKCDRINPSTGKPCNSIFSRPYDLTRHEDTIHNARKQKVKCQFCTEEKTFSRNDALTRHMRVVHPEVDFPGKTKRK